MQTFAVVSSLFVGAQAFSATSVSTVPPAFAFGDTLTSATFAFTTTNGISDTNPATITASANVFSNAGTLIDTADYVLTYDVGGANTLINDADVTVTANTLVITGAAVPATPMAGGVAITLQVKTSGLATGTADGVAVTFDYTYVTGGSDALAQTGWTPNVVVVGSDPITTFEGKRTKFWIPAEKYSSLLEAPEVSILAKPLQGPKDLQWFDRLQLTLPDGKLLAEVATAHGQKTTGETRVGDIRVMGAKRSLVGEQMIVEVGEGVQVAHYSDGTLMSTKDGKVKAAWYKTPYHIARTHGKNDIEHLHVETESIAFNIYSSHAGNEFPDDIAMQTKYNHLDFMVRSTMLPWSNYTGILPEIWEVIPRSAAVEAMTISPLDKAKVCDA